MFWGPSVWAGLRAGDAGNAEEELGVQQNTSAVHPTGRVALALRAPRHTAQLDFRGGESLLFTRWICCSYCFCCMLTRPPGS